MRNRLLILGMLLLVLIPATGCQCGPVCYTDKVTYERKVGALQDTSVIKGAFVLGTGSIGESSVIKYREILPDGGSIIRTVDERDAIVYEDATDNNARVLYRYIACGNVPIYETCHEACGYEANSVGGNRWYEIHVPPGTFITDFTIDLQ